MAFAADEIEDGSGKSAAIVYGLTADPVAEALAYLVQQAGRTSLSDTTGSIDVGGANERLLQEVYLIRGVRYVELVSCNRVQGSKAVDTQALLQPRYGQYIDGTEIAHDTIHAFWLQACWEAAELASSGENLLSVADDRREVKRKKITSALDTEWFQSGSSTVKTYHAVSSILDRILWPIGYNLERA